MTTRSRIGITNPDGSIDSIHCQCDGYPEYAGRILTTHYTTHERIRRPMDLGDLDILGSEPIAFETNAEYEQAADVHPSEGYEKCANTRTYNQPFEPTMHSPDKDAYMRQGTRCGEEYLHLFAQDKWQVYDVCGDAPQWRALAPSPH